MQYIVCPNCEYIDTAGRTTCPECHEKVRTVEANEPVLVHGGRVLMIVREETPCVAVAYTSKWHLDREVDEGHVIRSTHEEREEIFWPNRKFDYQFLMEVLEEICWGTKVEFFEVVLEGVRPAIAYHVYEQPWEVSRV